MMSYRREFRHAIRIARTELRRGWRSTVDRWTLVGVGLGLCALGGWTLIVGVASYFLGSIVPGGEPLAISDGIGGQFVAWVLFLAVMISFQVVERRARIDNPDLMFTTVSPRTVFLGLLSAELARELFLFGPFVLVGATGFALGSGAPTLVPVVVLVSVPVFVLTVLLGHTAGMAAKILAERMGGFGWLRTGVGVIAGLLVGIMPVMLFGGAETLGISVDLGSLLAVVPIAAYADLLAVGTPLSASFDVETALAVALVFGSIPLLFAFDYRLARALWFGGSTESTAKKTSARTPPDRLARGSTGWLVWWYWLRGLRSPSRFTHLVYYSFFLFPLLFDAFEDPSVAPSAAATVMAVLGVLFAGATFGLNPLGDERKALPAVLSTPDGKRFVRARIVAGAPWGLLALSGIFLGALIGRFDATETILLAVLVLSLCALSAAVAPVFGIVFPRFEPIAASKPEVITPSFGAMIGHAAVVATAGAGGLVAIYAPAVLGALSGSTPPFPVRLALAGGVAVVLVATSAWAHRLAVARFRAATVG